MPLKCQFRLISFFITTSILYSQPSRLLFDSVTASPDGRSAFFFTNITPDGMVQPYGYADLYAFGPDGIRRLTSQGVHGAFAFLSDGARLAVSAPGGLSIINTATGETQTVSASVVTGGHFHITPDGRTLLFTVAPFTGHTWFPFLYSVPVDGGTPVRLARGALDGRHVVADDGTIVFTSPGPADGAYTTTAAHNVYTMSAEGKVIQQLTQFSADLPWLAPQASLANITPDGKRILFTSTAVASSTLFTTTVWVMQSDGQGRRALPIDDRLEIVTFSTDGTLVAWSLNGQVHLQSVDTGDDRVVAQFAQSDIAEIDFTPDNSRLYLLLGEPSLNGQYSSDVPIGRALWSVDLAAARAQQLYAPRTLAQTGITNSYSVAPGGIPIVYGTTDSYFLTPGGFVIAYGSNLTVDRSLVPSTYPLPQTAGGVSLLINGRPAPIVALTPWQLTAQIPMDTPLGPVSFALRLDDGTSGSNSTGRIEATEPFPFSTADGCAFHAGTGVLADKTHPATPGEILETYGLGLGLTNPMVPAGQLAPASPLATVVNPFVATVDQWPFYEPAEVLWAGLLPGSLGVYQVNVRLPQKTPAGTVSIHWGAYSCPVAVAN